MNGYDVSSGMLNPYSVYYVSACLLKLASNVCRCTGIRRHGVSARNYSLLNAGSNLPLQPSNAWISTLVSEPASVALCR